MDNEHYFIASGSSFLPFPEESIVASASLSPVRGSRQVEAASPSAEVMRAQVEEITASAHSLAEKALIGNKRKYADLQTIWSLADTRNIICFHI